MNTVTETEIKLGSKIKPTWKLSKVRAIVGKETEKAIRIDLDYSSRSEYHWGFRKAASLRLSKKKKERTEHGPGILTLLFPPGSASKMAL